VFCLLVVLVNFQYLPSDWLERLLWKSLTVARGSSPKSSGRRVRMIFLFYSIVSLFNCMVVLFPALHDIHYTSVARYSLFVLRVPLNNNKPNQTIAELNCFSDLTLLVGSSEGHLGCRKHPASVVHEGSPLVSVGGAGLTWSILRKIGRLNKKRKSLSSSRTSELMRLDQEHMTSC